MYNISKGESREDKLVSQSEVPYLEYKYFLDKQWLKVFHHVASAGVFADSEVMLSTQEGRYSTMKFVNEAFQRDGKYDLMIECGKPDNGFIRWRQSHFPKVDDAIEINDSTAEGLEIDEGSSWKGTKYGQKFTGLQRTNAKFSVFDGTTYTDNWFFAIGMKIYEANNPNLVPCYSYAEEIKLYVASPYKFKCSDRLGRKISIHIECLCLFFIN